MGRSSASAGPLAAAVHQLKHAAAADQEQGLPLIVVPYMGHVGRELCEKSGVSWLDLSGNAQIVAPGLRIRIEGRPNKYRDRGRLPRLGRHTPPGTPTVSPRRASWAQ